MSAFRSRGFTLVELIMVLIVLSVLAVLALPRLGSALTLRDGGWRDAVISGLRSAHATAMTSQRQVCVNLSTGLLASCDDATLLFARSTSAPATDTISLVFLPNGTVTMGDGSTIADALSINILGLPAVTVYAGSGHVE
ncbi:MAG TPA: type II secretion system protein [Burkholderiaceae bacterium]|jgi:prepilin-type N-terminal cleavage/methylation domain-containing protein